VLNIRFSAELNIFAEMQRNHTTLKIEPFAYPGHNTDLCSHVPKFLEAAPCHQVMILQCGGGKFCTRNCIVKISVFFTIPITRGSSSLSFSPCSLSPLASSLTLSVFHSEHKTWLFLKSFPPYTFFLSYRTDSTDSRTFNVFILLNGWICLRGVLD